MFLPFSFLERNAHFVIDRKVHKYTNSIFDELKGHILFSVNRKKYFSRRCIFCDRFQRNLLCDIFKASIIIIFLDVHCAVSRKRRAAQEFRERNPSLRGYVLRPLFGYMHSNNAGNPLLIEKILSKVSDFFFYFNLLISTGKCRFFSMIFYSAFYIYVHLPLHIQILQSHSNWWLLCYSVHSGFLQIYAKLVIVAAIPTTTSCLAYIHAAAVFLFLPIKRSKAGKLFPFRITAQLKHVCKQQRRRLNRHAAPVPVRSKFMEQNWMNFFFD